MYTIILLFICGLWLSTGGKLTRREKWVTRNKSPFLFSNQTKNRMAPFFKPNTKWNGSVPLTKYLLEPFHIKNIGWSHSIPFRSPTKHTKLYDDFPIIIFKSKVHHRSLNFFGCVIPFPKLTNRPFKSSNLFGCAISVPKLRNHPFRSSNLFSCVISVSKFDFEFHLG